jgi:hypothetical protein
MKGLLHKEFMLVGKQLKLGAVVFIALIFLFNLPKDSDSFSPASYIEAYTLMMSIVLTMSTFAYDEQTKWNIYALSLPVSKNQIVRSKYLFALIILGLTSVVFVPMMFFLPGGFSEEQVFSIQIIISLALLFIALMIPLIYRFGTQKFRVAFLAIFFGSIALAFLVKQLNLFSLSSFQMDEAGLNRAVFFLLLLSVALLVVSYFISCRIFSKKEV